MEVKLGNWYRRTEAPSEGYVYVLGAVYDQQVVLINVETGCRFGDPVTVDSALELTLDDVPKLRKSGWELVRKEG